MTAIASPHDKVFKAAMKDLTVATAFLENALPLELQRGIRWDTLTLRPGTFVSKELQALHTDVLYSVEVEGQKMLIYILIEAQSEPEELMPFRLLEYMTKIWRYYLEQLPTQQKGKRDPYTKPPVGTRLPFIYPLIYYTGQRSPYPFSTSLFDCFADRKLVESYLFKPFALLDLNQLSDDEIKRYQFATGLMLIQKHIRDKDMRLTLEIMLNAEEWIKSMQQGGEYYEILLNYVVECGEISGDPEELFEKLSQGASPDRRKRIMTIAERLRQEGELKKSLKIARNLLRLGLEAKVVAKNTDLPLAEVESIQASLKKTSSQKKSAKSI